jgi:hypothetical protein
MRDSLKYVNVTRISHCISYSLLKSYVFVGQKDDMRLLASGAGIVDKEPPHHVYLLSFMLMLERGGSAFFY